jgi:hypothetical protein
VTYKSYCKVDILDCPRRLPPAQVVEIVPKLDFDESPSHGNSLKFLPPCDKRAVNLLYSLRINSVRDEPFGESYWQVGKATVMGRIRRNRAVPLRKRLSSDPLTTCGTPKSYCEVCNPSVSVSGSCYPKQAAQSSPSLSGRIISIGPVRMLLPQRGHTSRAGL